MKRGLESDISPSRAFRMYRVYRPAMVILKIPAGHFIRGDGRVVDIWCGCYRSMFFKYCVNLNKNTFSVFLLRLFSHSLTLEITLHGSRAIAYKGLSDFSFFFSFFPLSAQSVIQLDLQGLKICSPYCQAGFKSRSCQSFVKFGVSRSSFMGN